MSVHKIHTNISWDCDFIEERSSSQELYKAEMDAFKLKVREEVGLKTVYFKSSRVLPVSPKPAKKKAHEAYKRRTP